jgi:hypothetical protein
MCACVCVCVCVYVLFTENYKSLMLDLLRESVVQMDMTIADSLSFKLELRHHENRCIAHCILLAPFHPTLQTPFYSA